MCSHIAAVTTGYPCVETAPNTYGGIPPGSAPIAALPTDASLPEYDIPATAADVAPASAEFAGRIVAYCVVSKEPFGHWTVTRTLSAPCAQSPKASEKLTGSAPA